MMATQTELRLLDVIRITEDMFGQPVRFESAVDPDDPSHEFVIVNVESRGTPQEIVQQRVDWHRCIRDLSPAASDQLRLSILPLE